MSITLSPESTSLSIYPLVALEPTYHSSPGSRLFCPRQVSIKTQSETETGMLGSALFARSKQRLQDINMNLTGAKQLTEKPQQGQYQPPGQSVSILLSGIGTFRDILTVVRDDAFLLEVELIKIRIAKQRFL